MITTAGNVGRIEEERYIFLEKRFDGGHRSTDLRVIRPYITQHEIKIGCE